MSIDLSLDRIRVLLEHLPIYDRPTVHIAGTNGKGSVTALVSSILEAARLSVGRFNSPHLISVRDSIYVNGAPALETDYEFARAVVMQADKECGSNVSNFELLTCTALYLFQRAKVDVVVLEAGMGGRLDATNAIPDASVLVSALTTVDLDHQAFLGDTVTKIATEKASIARPGRPFVLGPQSHSEAAEAAKEVVGRIGGEIIVAPVALLREWPVVMSMACFGSPILAQLPLIGEHQLCNLGVAVTIISTILSRSSCASLLPIQRRVTPSVVAAGIKSTHWPGRLSFHRIPLATLFPGQNREGQLDVLADGAHNPASAEILATFIAQVVAGRKLHISFVLALSHSPPKTPTQTLSALLSFKHAGIVSMSVAAVGFSPVDGMPWVKSETPSGLLNVVKTIRPDSRLWSAPDDGTSHLEEALRWSTQAAISSGNRGLVVLAGSLYLVADFYRAFGPIDVA
ncbi:Mur ligase [Vararia minispora EC-137]|uniref:Mur ligase n=1 Tax=Vararia minispora EC-137 TaxID=1314806 RepID=A0ACB8QS36_9AGAM|nr:Mur ligase [Vararia minispora EC-137]